MKKSFFSLLLIFTTLFNFNIYSSSNKNFSRVKINRMENRIKFTKNRFNNLHFEWQKIVNKKLVLKRNSPQKIKKIFEKLIKQRELLKKLISDNKSLLGKMASALNKIQTERERRQEAQTAFENFDQKANDYFNKLSTLMKEHKEMMSSINRNLM